MHLSNTTKIGIYHLLRKLFTNYFAVNLYVLEHSFATHGKVRAKENRPYLERLFLKRYYLIVAKYSVSKTITRATRLSRL